MLVPGAFIMQIAHFTFVYAKMIYVSLTNMYQNSITHFIVRCVVYHQYEHSFVLKVLSCYERGYANTCKICK